MFDIIAEKDISTCNISYSISRLFVIAIVFMFTAFNPYLFSYNQSVNDSTTHQKWVGTWSTAPQLVEPHNNPPNPGLSNNTLRQVLRVSIGGDSLRIRFSNEFSSKPVTMKEVRFAISNGGSEIDTSTNKIIYFGGKHEVTINGGSAVISDPFHFDLQPRTEVAITIYFGNTSSDVTGHPGSRTTSYLLTGNKASQADFSNAVKTDHWYVINTIDVLAPEAAAAVVILGNSITDGRGSGTNKQNRWPDELARRLQENPDTRLIAVLNQGIGGNAVLRGGLGPTALNRFQRDVIDQNGVKWLIIFEGINDIGGAWGAQGSTKVAQDLIAAYEQMIDSAHANGIKVYGATLLPFAGSSYDSPDHQNVWRTVNDWIKNSGRFDAVIDLEKALFDPANPFRLLPSADTGDHLHPNENGHRMIAEAVDLNLFTEKSTSTLDEKPGKLPNTFQLLQNYPNPFNPATKLRFTLPSKSQTKLIVFDSLGRELQTLIDKEIEAGYHEIIFNANSIAGGLPSGVYFYRIQAGDFIETKKMILLK